MALFFDSAWFDARLSEIGASREDLASALRIGGADLALIYKDQREFQPQEVARAATFFRVPPEVVVRHAGAGTLMPPLEDAPSPTALATRLERAERRITLLEAELSRVLAQLVRLEQGRS